MQAQEKQPASRGLPRRALRNDVGGKGANDHGETWRYEICIVLNLSLGLLKTYGRIHVYALSLSCAYLRLKRPC